MSSTTSGSRGQALAIFAISLTAILIAAALAFDGGMMILERRDQQNAADAAAIAGARHVVDNVNRAKEVALDVADVNGFSNGSAVNVVVNVGPASGPHAGDPDFIEVLIDSNRPSIFAGIMGIANWDVGARAVAANKVDTVGNFAILSLDPEGCTAFDTLGSGSVEANGDIQVNSKCTNAALKVGGQGTITVSAGTGKCSVVGTDGSDNPEEDGAIQGDPTCKKDPGAEEVPDPLLIKPQPSYHTLGLDIADPWVPIPADGPLPPDGCPKVGSGTLLNDSTTWNAKGCQVPKNYDDGVWQIFPGVYPGGLNLLTGTYYLEPGIYYLAGGGLNVGPDVDFKYVDPDPGLPTWGGGVMFYSTCGGNDCDVVGDEVATPTAEKGFEIGGVKLNGKDADITLLPLADDPTYTGLVFWQDRRLSINGVDDFSIEGGDSDMAVRGTIYVPTADVKVTGDEGTLLLDQMIAFRYSITGGGGSITALKDAKYGIPIELYGLVE